MYGETFYGRHTAQHQLQWSQIKIRNEIQKLYQMNKSEPLSLHLYNMLKLLKHLQSEWNCLRGIC